MQLPPGVRQKMLALDLSVKTAMLASSPTALAAFLPSANAPTSKHVRKAKSSGGSLFPRVASNRHSLSEKDEFDDFVRVESRVPSSPKKGAKERDRDVQMSPEAFAMTLKTHSMKSLDAGVLKKLRVVLRTAGVVWVAEWNRCACSMLSVPTP
jgi:hypothetical protein